MNRDSEAGKLRHILHVIDALNYGGAQELLVLLAKCSPKNRYRTTICVLQPNPELKAKAEFHGAEVICFNRPRPSILKPHRFFSYFYNNVRDIVSFCRREHVDVIQCHLSDAEFIGILAGHTVKVDRILTTLHDPLILPRRHSHDPRNLLRLLLTSILYKWTHAIIAVSEDLSQKIGKFVYVDPSKIRTIINGIDVDSLRTTPYSKQLATQLGLGPEQKVLLTAARLTLQKGHVYLIDAMARLVKDYPGIRLLLAGEGELKEELISRCASMGVLGHVQFLGGRPDMADILALADIFVLPSLWEGTSIALLEAMAAAKPIVATDIPGSREVLSSPKCGVLVPPGDSSTLAEAISYLFEHPETACEYGRTAGRVAGERFDVRQIITQLEPLWQKQCFP